MSQPHLLIVHPDPDATRIMASILRATGCRIEEAATDRVAVKRLEQDPADLVLAWSDPEDPEALELLGYVRRKHPRTPIILLFPHAHAERTREAQQRGAAAILKYPMPANQLRAAVEQWMPEPAVAARPAGPNGNGHGSVHGNGRGNGHGAHAAAVATAPASAEGPDELAGDDPNLRRAIELAGLIAPAGAPVLIVGERGTGVAALARKIHARSPRAGGPFVEVACGGLSEAALEADLFGRRGVGLLDGDRPGRVAQAEGGTLFLDEVAGLSPPLQARLLRLIRDGEFEPHAPAPARRADVRVIVGTREDLAGRVEADGFRAELYYALSAVTLKLPPLRDRAADIPRLAEAFRARFAASVGRPVAFAPEALEALKRHDWPGNAAELRSAVEQAVLRVRGPWIEPADIPLSARSAPAAASPGRTAPGRAAAPGGILPLKEALEGPERQLILQALQALNWNRQETARVLDINRTTLYKKMKKYGLLPEGEPAWAN